MYERFSYCRGLPTSVPFPSRPIVIRLKRTVPSLGLRSSISFAECDSEEAYEKSAHVAEYVLDWAIVPVGPQLGPTNDQRRRHPRSCTGVVAVPAHCANDRLCSDPAIHPIPGARALRNCIETGLDYLGARYMSANAQPHAADTWLAIHLPRVHRNAIKIDDGQPTSAPPYPVHRTVPPSPTNP